MFICFSDPWVAPLSLQEEIAKDLLSGDDEETQSSADDLTPSVTSHETTDFFPRTLRCKSDVPDKPVGVCSYLFVSTVVYLCRSSTP